MSFTTITQGNTADITVTDNGDVLSVICAPGGSAKLTIVSGLSGFQEREFGGQLSTNFPASGVVRVTASSGSVQYELGNGASQGSTSTGAQPEDILTTKRISALVGGLPATLTNPTVQATNSIAGYTQISIQNKNAGTLASADIIAYPDNVTSSDLTGFMDMGITSSGFTDSNYAVTTANEGYLFMSAPSGAGKTGNMIIGTDSTGSANAIKFATGGFSATTNFRLIIDANGVKVLSGALGYATGSGGAVTQITSRTTGVTLNKSCGQITMFSAAGSATAATFTVTNSAVAATDTVILNQVSGTNLYVLAVTAVAAGSFNVTFFTTGGTATDAPVINFSVIKSVAA